MSLCFAVDSKLSGIETRRRLVEMREKYASVLDYFWISNVRPALPRDIENDKEHGFVPQSAFMIQWNKERPEFVALMPKVFYEAFGSDLLIRDDNFDVIPPP